VAPVTFGLFMLPGGRPGQRFAGADDDDHAAPTEGQGLDETHLHQPYGKVGRKTLDGKEDDAAEEESGLGFLPSPKVLYL
jgi:hypothetical protein